MMAKIKPNRALQVVVSAVACLTLFIGFAGLPGLAAAGPPPTRIPQVAPLNPDFLDFLQNRPAKFYGYIPPPVDLRHLEDIPVREPALEAETALEAPLTLPATFDWRTSDNVTPVKDQSTCGTCWVFGTLAALESKVLIGESAAFDFSEQNLVCCTDPSWVYLTSPPDYRCMGGGWSWLAADTLSKKGTRLEACDPYNTGTINTETCNDTCTTAKYLTGYRLLAVNTTAIKDSVYTYGPISVAMYMEYPSSYYNPTTNVYNYTGPATTNHIVCIVGWNDTIAYPGGSGAWIVKNSWGTDWGGTCGYGSERGYFYLAYGCGNMQEAARYEYKDYSASEKIYYWDEAGWVASAGSGTDYAWMANVFTTTASGTLTHVDFWTTANNAAYEIYICQDGNPADGLTNQRTSQSGACQEAGYYSIELSSPVSVTAGQTYTIAVKLTTTGYGYPIPIELKLPTTGKTVCNPPIQTGVSYMSPDGTSWEDIGAGYMWNACLRARVSEGIVSVVVTPASIAYGTLALGASKNTTPGQQLTVTNNGGVTADFTIKSSNATRDGGTTWALVPATPGLDQFKHEFSTNSGSNWTALMTGYQGLATGIAPNATQVFDLQITMPSSTTDYLEHNITITILAVAAGG